MITEVSRINACMFRSNLLDIVHDLLTFLLTSSAGVAETYNLEFELPFVRLLPLEPLRTWPEKAEGATALLNPFERGT